MARVEESPVSLPGLSQTGQDRGMASAPTRARVPPGCFQHAPVMAVLWALQRLILQSLQCGAAASSPRAGPGAGTHGEARV